MAKDKTVFDPGAAKREEDKTKFESSATVPDDAATQYDDGSMTDAALFDAAEQTGANASELSFKKGSTILETYRVESDPIHGGMGSVWRVHHTGWNADLAMKRPKSEMFQSEKQKEMFKSECDAWINLGLHPNIVSCYYVRELSGTPSIFSEWMDGGSLERAIVKGTLYEGGKSEQQVRILDIAVQFARGLHYAHENGLIHQDVKPDNLLLTKEGEAKVADFGIAKARAALTVLDGNLTMKENGGGTMISASGGFTPAYCSMEQMDGKPLTRRTDIYSWAVSIMEMYTGSRPWANGVVAGLSCRGYFDNTRVPMPEALKELLAKCMNAEPDDRPHDFAEVENELLRIFRTETGADYPRPAPKAAADTADSMNNRALSYLDLGKPKEAEKLLAAALKTNRSNIIALFNKCILSWYQCELNDSAVLERLMEAPESELRTELLEMAEQMRGGFEEYEEKSEEVTLNYDAERAIAEALYDEAHPKRSPEDDARLNTEEYWNTAFSDYFKWPDFDEWKHTLGRPYVPPTQEETVLPDGSRFRVVADERNDPICIIDASSGRCVRSIEHPGKFSVRCEGSYIYVESCKFLQRYSHVLKLENERRLVETNEIRVRLYSRRYQICSLAPTPRWCLCAIRKTKEQLALEMQFAERLALAETALQNGDHAAAIAHFYEAKAVPGYETSTEIRRFYEQLLPCSRLLNVDERIPISTIPRGRKEWVREDSWWAGSFSSGGTYYLLSRRKIKRVYFLNEAYYIYDSETSVFAVDNGDELPLRLKDTIHCSAFAGDDKLLLVVSDPDNRPLEAARKLQFVIISLPTGDELCRIDLGKHSRCEIATVCYQPSVNLAAVSLVINRTCCSFLLSIENAKLQKKRKGCRIYDISRDGKSFLTGTGYGSYEIMSGPLNRRGGVLLQIDDAAFEASDYLKTDLVYKYHYIAGVSVITCIQTNRHEDLHWIMVHNIETGALEYTLEPGSPNHYWLTPKPNSRKGFDLQSDYLLNYYVNRHDLSDDPSMKYHANFNENGDAISLNRVYWTLE